MNPAPTPHPLARSTPGGRVRAIAHRAGNHLPLLREAEAIGVDFVEFDLWLWRSRLEVRHLKTLGPLPLLWDRWRLAPGWTPRLDLPALLAAARPETALLIDLKGRAAGLPAALRDTLARHAPDRPVVLCSRTWAHLDACADLPGASLAYSVGSERQLAALWRRFPDPFPHAVSIHAELLTEKTAARLKSRAAAVISWPVNTAERLARLTGLGVDGVTSDDLGLLRGLVSAGRPGVVAGS